MSVIVEKNPQQHLLICKGAPEEVLKICTEARLNGSVAPLTDAIRAQIDRLNRDLNEAGLRVLAVAYKEILADSKEYSSSDENNLTILGILAFLDPPKLSTAAALKKLNQYSVQVKVLTGDNELVTRKICSWVDLKIEGSLTGTQIEKLTDDELKNLVEKTTIFTKISPLQKSRIIASLKSNGHTVGYIGDGLNHAPALTGSGHRHLR